MRWNLLHTQNLSCHDKSWGCHFGFGLIRAIFKISISNFRDILEKDHILICKSSPGKRGIMTQVIYGQSGFQFFFAHPIYMGYLIVMSVNLNYKQFIFRFIWFWWLNLWLIGRPIEIIKVIPIYEKQTLMLEHIWFHKDGHAMFSCSDL